MDGLTFVAHLVDGLAWPAVVVFVIIQLRPYFAGLASRLDKLKLPGGTEFSFHKELRAAKHIAQEISGKGSKLSGPVRTRDSMAKLPIGGTTPEHALSHVADDEAFAALCSDFPEAAVLYAFQKVEHVLSEMAEKLEQQAPLTVPVVLRDRGLINEQLLELYRRIYNLRNQAVHSGRSVKISSDEAREYRGVSELVAGQFRDLLPRL
jgi:hypothetical protein